MRGRQRRHRKAGRKRQSGQKRPVASMSHHYRSSDFSGSCQHLKYCEEKELDAFLLFLSTAYSTQHAMLRSFPLFTLECVLFLITFEFSPNLSWYTEDGMWFPHEREPLKSNQNGVGLFSHHLPSLHSVSFWDVTEHLCKSFFLFWLRVSWKVPTPMTYLKTPNGLWHFLIHISVNAFP